MDDLEPGDVPRYGTERHIHEYWIRFLSRNNALERNRQMS